MKNLTQTKKISLLSGISLLVMAIIAPIAIFGIITPIFESNDATIIFDNLQLGLQSFRLAVALLIFVVLLDILLSFTLYLLFQKNNKTISLVLASFRLLYSVVFAVAISYLLQIVYLTSNTELFSSIGTLESEILVSVAYQQFNVIWDIALIFFGFHLVALGYLTYRSESYPKFLGLLIVIAGIGYMVDSFGVILFSDYSIEIAAFTFIGEVLLIIWLFYNAFKKNKSTE